MRILICDDDTYIVERLDSLIRNFFKQHRLQLPKICAFPDGESLLADSQSQDIIFLDVEMPGMNGIYIGNELKKRNKNVIIIIVTSYTEYLDEAMRFHVFRYLSKPIEKQRLWQNLHDAINLYHSTTARLPIETKEGVTTVLTSEIVMVEAQGRIVIVHTICKDYKSIHNMLYWEKTLPSNCFFQTHRSFIVNFEHVTDFDHTLIHMANYQFDAYLTRRKYTAFKTAYLLYLESMR